MEKLYVLVLVAFVCVTGLPLDASDSDIESHPQPQHDVGHSVRRRFINPMFSQGSLGNNDMAKIRTKRSYDECEKLQLCKLHARSRVSFFAAYELYFVNKENARLWDHHARSMADCEQRYGDCYDA